MNSNFTSRLDKAMTPEQFTQVVDAILNGKYSWACVLILQFAGYNPLHYIPYRTYNRLMKENSPSRRTRQAERCENICYADSCYADSLSLHSLNQLEDLNHLETLNETHSNVRGGSSYSPLDSWLFSANLN